MDKGRPGRSRSWVFVIVFSGFICKVAVAFQYHNKKKKKAGKII